MRVFSPALRPRLSRGLILFLLLAAGSEAAYRGPWRAIVSGTEVNDFISPYVQTRVWLGGEDPYDLDVLARSWPVATNSSPAALLERGIPSPYPITGFPLLAPLSALSWKTANLIWAALEIAFFALFVYSLSTITQQETLNKGASGTLVVLAALAFAPFHTGMALENITVAAIACATAAIAFDDSKHVAAVALLLGAAIALKPTIAAPFFMYWIMQKQWRTVSLAATSCAVLLSIAQIRMLLAGASWLPNFTSNGRRLFAPGTVYDFSRANPLRFDLVNAQVLLSQLLSSQMSQFAAVGITISVVLLWLHFRKTATRDSRLLDLAILSAAMLVPLYHRFYDAGLLIFAVAWAIKELSISASKYAILTLAAATPFLIPGAAILRYVAHNNSAVAELSETFWWKFSIAPHQVWMVLIILTLLLGAQRALCAKKVQATTASCSAEAA